MSFADKLIKFPRKFITDTEIDQLISGTADSRYGKVKRYLAQGKLLRIRRGLYCINNNLVSATPNLFELAQYIYGQSYISFESALSYHGLIPERVYTTTSATSKRSKEFKTPLGVFSYIHLPSDNLYVHVELLELNNSKFFMATPWKAICDYIFYYKKDWKGLRPLEESLRVSVEELPMLSEADVRVLGEYYKSKRIKLFLEEVLNEQIRKLELTL